ATRRFLEYDAYGNAVFERTLSSTPSVSFELFTHRQFFSDPGRNRFGFTTRVTKSRDAEGGEVLTQTEWVYDPDSLHAVEVARWDSSRGSFLRTRFAYDLFGNLIRRVAPEGEAQDLAYDPVHRTFPISVSSQAGPGRPVLVSRYGHDPRFGAETSRIDANGTFRLAEYDGFGRLERVSGPHPETGEEKALLIRSWRHEAGLTVRETHRRESWDGDRWSIGQEHLDSLRRPILNVHVGAEGGRRLRSRSYASNHRLTSRSRPYVPGDSPVLETFEFDSMGRLTRAVDADGLVTRNTYWAPAHAVTVVGEGTPHESEQHLEYLNVAGHNRVRSFAHDNGQKMDFRYDPLGRLERVASSDRGDLLHTVYDSLGRPTRQTDPDRGTVQLLYNGGGRLESRVRNGGQSIETYSYDGLGRLTREISRSGGGLETIDYGYDDAGRGALGRVSSVVSSASYGFQYAYGPYGRLRETETRILGRTWFTRHERDPRGRALRSTLPDGSVLERTLGEFGDLAALDFTEVDGMRRRMLDVSGYLPSSKPTAADLGPLDFELAYTDGGALRQRRVFTDLEGLSQWHTLHRSAGYWVDGITDALDPAGGESFAYDSVEQLSSARGGYAAESFTYGQNGDVLSKNEVDFRYEGGRLVQGLRGSEVAFEATYGPAGKTLTRLTEAGLDRLSYGARERLSEVRREDAGGERILASFLYDHLGRRLYKKEAGVETFYVSRDFEQTVHSGGTQTTRYLRAPRGGFATVSRGAAVDLEGYPADGDQYVLTDHLGSVRMVFDAAGRRTARIDYTPFGEIWRQEGVARVRRGFAGMERDRSTGLLYDRARYYDPSLGRFITPDSRLGGGLHQFAAFNRYAYVANNPLLFTDPTGHSIFSKIGHWISRHAAALGSLVLGAAEVALGVAVDALSGGALAPLVGNSLIGAGLGGMNYSATHFNNFSWKGWGISEGVGAATGLVIGGLGELAAAGEAGAELGEAGGLEAAANGNAGGLAEAADAGWIEQEPVVQAGEEAAGSLAAAPEEALEEEAKIGDAFEQGLPDAAPEAAPAPAAQNGANYENLANDGNGHLGNEALQGPGSLEPYTFVVRDSNFGQTGFPSGEVPFTL
ncbi:MAG: RHS repeat-associated core domain-containing protein, partial [Acidobacteriota bacterium]